MSVPKRAANGMYRSTRRSRCGVRRSGALAAIGVSVLLSLGGGLSAWPPHDGGVLVGRVTDGRGAALEGVLVTVAELSRRTVSDAAGRYRIGGVPPGTYTVILELLGYASERREVRVRDGETTFLDVVLRTSAIEIAAISVAVDARVTDRLTSPPDIAVVSGREKQRLQRSSLGGVLDDLAGVANISTGSQVGKPVIRGLSGSRIRVATDGITMNYQQYGVRHWASVDPFLAERIEVVRGAASVLYGSDALGGAVNLLPRPVPQAAGEGTSVRGRVLGEYSTNNREIGLGLTLEGAAGDVGWTGSLIRRSAGDLRVPAVPTFPEDAVSGVAPRFSGRLDHTDYDQLSASLGLGYHADYGMASLHYSLWRDQHNFLLPDGGGVGQNLENDVLLGKAILVPGGDWILRARLAYMRNLRQSNRPGALRDRLPEAIVTDIELESHSGRLEADHPTFGPLSGQVGVEYQWQRQVSRGSERLVPSAEAGNLAGFIYEEAALGRLSLSLGARLDRRAQTADPAPELRLPDRDAGETEAVLEQDYAAIGGSLGAAYRITDGLTLATNLGRGFRAPSIFELHAFGVHGGVSALQIGNPNLRSESSLSSDLSIRWRSSGLEAQVTGYRNRIDNYIYLVNTGEIDAGSGLPVMTTVQGDAVLWGGDAQMKARLLPWLQLGALFETVAGRNNSAGHDLPLLPATRAEGRVTFTQGSLGRLKDPYLSITLRYTADKEAAGPFEPFWQFDENSSFGVASTDEYALLDVGFGFDLPLAGSRASVDLMVRNLWDAAYRDFLDTYKGYALSPGRDIALRVSLPFRAGRTEVPED